MRHVPRRGLALPAVTLFALVSLAATDQAAVELPPAREIIDRHIKEIGGRAVVLSLTSFYATGTVSMPAAGVTGTVEAFHAKPNKFVQRVTLTGIGSLEEGFDGTIGWSLSPLTGPTLLSGKQLEQRTFDAEFFQELKADDRYRSITTVEKTTFEGRPVYKIRLTKKNGDEALEFYDVETGLKAGSISTRETPMGPLQETTVATDYRKFGVLLHPATTKVSVMGTQMIVAIVGVEYGKVDPAVFNPPAQIKALIK